MNKVKNGAILLALGLAPFAASAQLIGPLPAATPAFASLVLANPGASGLTTLLTDNATLNPPTPSILLGGETFLPYVPNITTDWTLGSAVGQYGSAVVTFLGNESVDSNRFGQFNVNIGDGAAIFTNYNAIPDGTSYLFTAAPLSDVLSFDHIDGSVTAKQNNTNVFSIFRSSFGGLDYLLIGIDDRGADVATRDYDDLVVLVTLTPNQDIPGGVPEPSTYGAVGAALVAGLVLRRKFRKSA